MVDLTVLELHLHDGVEFSPRGAIGGDDGLFGGDADEDAGDADEGADSADEDVADEPSIDSADGGGYAKLVAAVVGLVVLAGVAALVSRSGDEDDDIEVAVEEVN